MAAPIKCTSEKKDHTAQPASLRSTRWRVLLFSDMPARRRCQRDGRWGVRNTDKARFEHAHQRRSATRFCRSLPLKLRSRTRSIQFTAAMLPKFFALAWGQPFTLFDKLTVVSFRWCPETIDDELLTGRTHGCCVVLTPWHSKGGQG